jgi:hypothetical protein
MTLTGDASGMRQPVARFLVGAKDPIEGHLALARYDRRDDDDRKDREQQSMCGHGVS